MANIKKIATVINEERTEYEIKDAVAREFIEANRYQWNVGESPVLYVAKSNSRFTTINDAIEYARTYCTTTNRVTIVIASGMYLEYIDLDNNPGIDFYGLGDVTIRSNVAWRLSTLRCSNTITVYNIHFENYYTPGEGEHAGYALHADPVTANQYFYNCTFYSNNNSGIGVGMGMNGATNFYNCVFRSAVGAVYAHNNVTPGTTGQWLRFYRCHFETIDDSSVIRIDDACSMQTSGGTSTMGLVFIGCSGNNNGVVFRRGTPVETLSYIPNSSLTSAVFLYKSSCLNESPALNSNKQTLRIASMFNTMGSATFYVNQPDAYKYNWTIESANYKEYNASTETWGNWIAYTGTIACSIVEEEPEVIKIVMMGNQIMRPGGRTFEIVFNATPRKDITFPITF